MGIFRHLSVDRVRVLIGGLGLIVLSGTSFPLAAQAGGRGGAELVAKSDSASVDLPDAPMPAPLARSDSGLSAREAGISSSAQDKQPKPGEQSPQTPPGAPSLADLGLTPEQVHGDDQQQALLDKRTQMLKIHQRLGLITIIPVAAACISSAGAPPDRNNPGSTTSRDVHVALGGVTVGMYAATAFYAIRAPKVSNEPARGGIKLHKYLIYIHAPGMILTPILGAMAFNQANSGEKVHGIASAHSAVAWATAGSYVAAIVAVSWPIHVKFW
ncbi:MAG: hypothetical protein JWQ49_4384 [Edaphobacter sp.]|nr:hypothetical protein [Edaphobacter sp.]